MKNPFYMVNNLLWGKRQTHKIVQVTEDDKCPMPLTESEQREVDFIRWVGTIAMVCLLTLFIDTTIEELVRDWYWIVGLFVGVWALCKLGMFLNRPGPFGNIK
jgi:hypothetical protein